MYLDNASTTPLRTEVCDAMYPWLTSEYGNPNSHHAIGHAAAYAIDDAREIVAAMINAEPDEIFFTSCGSESNTWAINGLYNIDTCGPFITSSIEHHSILRNRHKKCIIDVDEYGTVDLSLLEKSIAFNTPIVAMMMVNNEIGTIEPISEIDKVCIKHDTFMHIDAVQAFGHIPIDVKKYYSLSTLSASAHKIGGPKGIGCLYIQKDVQELYYPLICGGQQEFGKRGGTENVAGIVGFAKACELAQKEMKTVYDKHRAYLCALWRELEEAFENDIRINGYPVDSENRIANNLNFSIRGVRAEELMELLNQNEVYVSSGSACNSDSDEPSHVLKAIGLTDDEANTAIRVSLGSCTTGEEIDLAAKIIINSAMMLMNR